MTTAHNDPTRIKAWGDYKALLTGYVRVIKFLPSGFKPDGTTIDPSKADSNLLQEVFEGYFENGGMSKEAHYGRWFKNGEDCFLGYFSYDQVNTDYRFLGKGLHYKSSGELVSGSEGLYKVTLFDSPATAKTIVDFRTNELPE